jgi:hypothetical protein
MKRVTLAISALAVFAFSAGMAAAQMEPIPNPPETHHTTHKSTAHHSTHHTTSHHKTAKAPAAPTPAPQ